MYWSRVPLENTDRIEVVDGSTSSLYGNYAMGGVINFVANPATPKTVEVKAQYGSRNTPKVDFLGSHVWGKLGVTVDGNVFDTDGYAIVRANERGRVDNNAAARFWNLNVKLDYAATDRVRTFVRAGYFNENRDNGKASTIDGTTTVAVTLWSWIAWRKLSTSKRGSDTTDAPCASAVFISTVKPSAWKKGATAATVSVSSTSSTVAVWSTLAAIAR